MLSILVALEINSQIPPIINTQQNLFLWCHAWKTWLRTLRPKKAVNRMAAPKDGQ